jgi:heme exporter protein CcmD
MLPEFDKNAAYIIASYAIGAAALAGAILMTWLAARRARARLAALETDTP